MTSTQDVNLAAALHLRRLPLTPKTFLEQPVNRKSACHRTDVVDRSVTQQGFQYDRRCTRRLYHSVLPPGKCGGPNIEKLSRFMPREALIRAKFLNALGRDIRPCFHANQYIIRYPVETEIRLLKLILLRRFAYSTGLNAEDFVVRASSKLEQRLPTTEGRGEGASLSAPSLSVVQDLASRTRTNSGVSISFRFPFIT